MLVMRNRTMLMNASVLGVAFALTTLCLVGCGGGGGGIAPGTGGNESAGTSDRGAIQLTVAFDNASRDIPTMSSLMIYVMGEGMTEVQYRSLTPGGTTVTTSFSDVPRGLKVVLGVGTEYQSGVGTVYRAIGALLAHVQPNSVARRTLFLEYAGGLNAVIDGTKDVNGIPTEVVQWSDGTQEFLSYDKKPPQIGPANVLWHAFSDPNPEPPWPQMTLIDPPIVLVPAKLERGAPITATNVSLKKTDGTEFMAGDWECSFEGYDGMLSNLEGTGSILAARVHTTFTQTRSRVTGTVIHEMLDWYAKGDGRILRLELDPTKTDDQDGRVVGIKMRLSSLSNSWWTPLQPLFSLVDGQGISYVSNWGAGQEVTVTVALFGLTRSWASNGSDQITLGFTADVDQTGDGATNANFDPANYQVKVNGTTVAVNSVAAGSYTTELVLTLLNPLSTGDQCEVIVTGGPGKVHAADGTPLPNNHPYNDSRFTVE